MNKKGFTLIELLAVIVILAIIALIAVPLILNVIDDAKRGAFKDSAYGISKSAEYTYLDLVTKGHTKELNYRYEDGEEYPSDSDFPLNYNGSKPQSGNVRISSDGKISLALFDGVYCAIKTEDSSIIDVNKSDESECVLEESTTPVTYTDNSGAAYPELSEGMIPITWDGSNWIKADLTQEWYNYENKEWANAVLVTSETRTAYQNASSGTPVLEDDVLAYLVWVPRYRYQLFNVEAESVPVQTINIEFENKTTPKSNGSTNGSWLTHPSFTFGSEELDGFWVGKFETTGTAATPTVKPGVSSLRSQNVSTQFATAQLFNAEGTYGLSVSNDAHMMRNMEWGAVAYLTQSKYGKNAEVWINPSSSYITGCAGEGPSVEASSGCSYHYNTVNGQEASTTGNVYGIYDMSGGAWERVMGGMYNSDNSTIMVSNTGFDQATIDSTSMSKYIDKYNYGTSSSDYTRTKLGDATGEVRGWTGDYAHFVYSSSPWFNRGGHISNTSNAGAFAFSNTPGDAYSSSGFRVVVLGD